MARNRIIHDQQRYTQAYFVGLSTDRGEDSKASLFKFAIKGIAFQQGPRIRFLCAVVEPSCVKKKEA
jgi:hypothetical protein